MKYCWALMVEASPNKVLVRTQTTLRFVCAAQHKRYTVISPVLAVCRDPLNRLRAAFCLVVYFIRVRYTITNTPSFSVQR